MLVTKCSECGSEEGFVMALHSLWIGPASEGFVGTWGDETCLACGAFREMQGISSSRSGADRESPSLDSRRPSLVGSVSSERMGPSQDRSVVARRDRCRLRFARGVADWQRKRVGARRSLWQRDRADSDGGFRQ
jgi:hypothetical protein